jgi:trans-aconitate methyltransferase
MESIDFSNIAKKYRRISTAQSSASEILFDLIDIKPGDSVLDVGCGTGNLTSKIKDLTSGKVIGIDLSEGMINEAVKNYENCGIQFLTKNIQHIGFEEEFDAVFCNSALQWFTEINLSLKKLYNALKPGGRIAVQAPATALYCPNFVNAINGIMNDDEKLRIVFSSFNSPWLFLETAEEYAVLFEKAGFKVALSRIETQPALFTPEKVFEIFSSGAIAGYLNQDYYSVNIDEDYIQQFKNKIKEKFKNQADSHGLVNLIFNRIYLLAFKH